MNCARLVLLCLVLTTAVASPQAASRTRYADGGRMRVHLDPVFNPPSLLQLVQHSPLIVDGTVQTVLPPIDTSRDHIRPGIETHSIIAVSSVLWGTLADHRANILLAQVGGELGKWAIEVDGDTLVRPAERYVLFLVSDEREDLPNTSGMPRYSVLGVSTGKVRINKDAVSFADSASMQLHAYDGMQAESFLQMLKDLIKHPYTDSQLPIHPTPKRNDI